MGWFQEERAEAFRLALGLDGFPEREHIALLADFLGGLLALRSDCRSLRTEDGSGQPGAPILRLESLSELQIDECVLHAATHYLLDYGAAALLREPEDPNTLRRRRLAGRWQAREEREVEDFLLAWLLPAHLVHLIRREADLVEASGCAPELVRLRKERLHGKSYHLTEPPRWSAYRHFTLTRWEAAPRCALRVRSRADRTLIFEVPATPDILDTLQWRINAELIALTYEEFREKYRRFEAGDGSETEALIPLSDLGRWTTRFCRIAPEGALPGWECEQP